MATAKRSGERCERATVVLAKGKDSILRRQFDVLENDQESEEEGGKSAGAVAAAVATVMGNGSKW